MKKMPLSDIEAKRLGFNYAVQITKEDFVTGSSNTLVLPIADVISGSAVRGAAIFVKKPFVSSDGTLTSITASVGDDTSTNRYLGGIQVIAGSAVSGVSNNAFVYNGANTIDLTLTGTADKLLSTVTDGELWIILQIGSVNPGV